VNLQRSYCPVKMSKQHHYDWPIGKITARIIIPVYFLEGVCQMRRKLLGFFTWLALAGLLFATACTGGGAASKDQPTPTPLPTPVAASKPTYKVQRGDILAQIQFSARIIPSVQEELFFRANGRVRNVYVRNGDTVTNGQILADLLQLDDMEAQKRQQDINLRRSEINLEMAWLRQQLAATQTPNWEKGYEIRMKMNEYEVEMAQLAYEETKLNYENLDGAIQDSQIISPIDGKVLSISLLEGSEIRAFNPLVTIGDDSQLEVGATLTSTQMQELSEGMEATIELTSRPGEKLAGTVRSLPYPYGTGGGTKSTTSGTSTTGTSADNTSRVSLTDPELIKGFRLGDLVQVTVIKESKEGVLWLPPNAIRTFEGRNFVVVQTDGLPRRVDIRVGIRNEQMVEILEGLEEGQVIVSP
jgi:membrane fusion protein, macrolide-specific efflux system